MSKISNRCKEKQMKSIGDHHKFLQRITKTLYYGKLPMTDRLSLPVTEVAADLFSEAKSGHSLERLHCNDVAKISRNACVSPCSLVLAVLYLEYLRTCNPDYLQQVAPSELFLVSLMVSSKFLYDDGEDDEVFVDEWATSGGISVKELIQLEKEFLAAMNWKIFVKENIFWKKLKELETTISKKEGCKRGWFTYTELNNLIHMIELNGLIQLIVNVTAVLVATYTAGILTLIGSMFIVSNIPGNCLQSSKVDIADNKTYLTIENEKMYDLYDTDSKEIISVLEDVENNFSLDISSGNRLSMKHLDAADVLKTGIILASIKTVPNFKQESNKSGFDLDETATTNSVNDFTAWQWWSSTTMQWLTEISKAVEKFEFVPHFQQFTHNYYVDMSIANTKIINLQDEMQKATKLRMQDQLEASWHEEWTDVLKNIIFMQRPLSYYFHNFKS